jgi:ribosomal protein L31
MTKGIYIRTKETKRRMSRAKNGNTNGFKKGMVSWNSGKKMSKDFSEKLRLANLGKKLSKETKKKISLASKGITYEDKYGKIRAKKMKQKMSDSRILLYQKGKIELSSSCFKSGKQHPLYQGGMGMTSEKRFANNFANRHILRADRCEFPGCNNRKKLHHHHPDYKKPEIIIDVCPKHHWDYTFKKWRVIW